MCDATGDEKRAGRWSTKTAFCISRQITLCAYGFWLKQAIAPTQSSEYSLKHDCSRYICFMNIEGLIQQIRSKQTYLCVGLDTDVEKLPAHLKGKKNGVAEFNKAIIEATKDFCVSYKINTAFYESQGLNGWEAMEETLHAIPGTHFSIADAKRGDIGNTSAQYAKTFFETLPFDAVTVNPYMGEDSVRPFLDYENKVTILLGLTSNKGASDFEMLTLSGSEMPDSTHLYERVIEKAASWGTTQSLMFVIGATQASRFSSIRKLIPDHFLLVPGVGAQGGSLRDISEYAMNKNCGILVNVSRGIIYAGDDDRFGDKAHIAAKEYGTEMMLQLQENRVLQEE